MSEVFTKHHYKIFQCLSEGNLPRALEWVNKAEKSQGMDSTLGILKAYILVELQNYTEAKKLAMPPEDSRFVYFMKKIFKALDRIIDYKQISRDSLEEQYEAAVLSDDFSLCKNVGIKLLPKNPIYLVFSLIFSYEAEKKDTNLRLLRLALEKCPAYPNIHILLVKLNILVDHVIASIRKAHAKNLTYFYLLKEIFLRYRRHRPDVVEILSEEKFASGEAGAMEFFIEKFDDWKIYKQALQDGVELKETKRYNYLFYKLSRNKDHTVLPDLCLKQGSFKSLFRCFDILDTCGDALPENLKLLFATRSGSSEKNLRRAYEMYSEVPSLLSTKIILAHLISTRKEMYLLLALYITKKMYEKFDTYEIKLVHLFMCRFFCILPEVLKVIQDLDIKTIQHESFGFVWNDLCIFLGTRNKELADKYLNCHYDGIRKINDYVLPFVSAGKLDHAFDLIQLRKKLLCSSVYREVKDQKIVSEYRETMFTGLLGSACSYLFEKLTIRHAESTLKVRNIFGEYEGSSNIRNFLKNNLYDLDSDDEFIKWMEKFGFEI